MDHNSALPLRLIPPPGGYTSSTFAMGKQRHIVTIAGISNSVAGLSAQVKPRPQTPVQDPILSIGTTGTKQSPRHNPGNSALQTAATEDNAATLQGQIRVAREQLNDWVTCVSATTPKGQAEIGSLSAQISAAQEQIERLPQTTAASVDVWA